MNQLWKNYLTRRLESEIALAVPMGIEVVEATPLKVTLKAPLGKNDNHCDEGFAGSIFSLYALCGWCLANVVMQSENIENYKAVLADANIKYYKPLAENLRVTCEISEDQKKAFLKKYASKQRASLPLTASMLGNGETTSTFNGKFACVAE